MERKVDLGVLHQPGHVGGVEERAARRLAMALHRSESTFCAVSWSAQERAQDYANTHTLSETLDEGQRLEALALPGAEA